MLLTSPDSLNYIPQRIISLVPSQTELLYDLGLDTEVAGITKFCIHPKHWFDTKTRVGGTKMIRPEVINSLQPDLIIANKEENVKEQIEELAKRYPVWVSDIHTLDDSLQMINDIGVLTKKESTALDLVENIRNCFDRFAKSNTKKSALNTGYLIWRKPYMTVGSDTFIHEMLTGCGLTNIFCNEKRYPEITVDQLKEKGCELLLLSSEPYPFKQQHIDELQDQLPGCKIILVDGEMFSWYGSRLLKSPDYFTALLQKI